MDFTDFTTLTFDCYGTLIDWETGIAAALRPWAERAGIATDEEALLAAFGRVENRLQRESPTAPYPALLRDGALAIAAEFAAPMTDDEAEMFSTSIKDWPAFPDSPDGLAYLKRHYKLVVLSNVDNASFTHSNAKLGVEFDAIFTAQDIGSYKPDLRNFRHMLDRLAEMGIAKDAILHTAQSLYHDIAPARRMGLATNWINRRGLKPGSGATPAAEAVPDIEHASIAEFVERHKAAVAD
jgi:2-haloalkanoic acid dehalogenase type II